ncbi:MAG: hypothetical protein HW402_1477, partial [Dehalococcoidales bacterium]|nr:hypothetical protein [Dehalococcoidales bacterium]
IAHSSYEVKSPGDRVLFIKYMVLTIV